MSDSDFVLIVSKGCKYCREARELIENLNNDRYEIKLVSEDPDAAADFDWFDNGTGIVPMLIVDDPEEGEHSLQGGKALARIKKEIP